jgi:hypothetical protein
MKQGSCISVLTAIIFLSIFIFRDLPLYGQISDNDTLRVAQLQEFQNVVDHDRRSAQRWWYGWLAGYSAATAGQGIVYLSTDAKPTRQDMALGAATTLLGAIGVLLTPIVPPKSEYQILDLQPGDSTFNCFDNTNPEKLLKELAKREKEGRSWKFHAVSGAVNIGSGLITWLGFKRSLVDGLLNFALNTVITEAQVWTQPVKAIKDYQNYCGYKTESSVPHIIKPERKLYLCSYPSGFSIRLDF